MKYRKLAIYLILLPIILLPTFFTIIPKLYRYYCRSKYRYLIEYSYIHGSFNFFHYCGVILFIILVIILISHWTLSAVILFYYIPVRISRSNDNLKTTAYDILSLKYIKEYSEKKWIMFYHN